MTVGGTPSRSPNSRVIEVIVAASMYSSVVTSIPLAMITGTVRVRSASRGNGASTIDCRGGLGYSRNVASVTRASVPSEPVTSCVRSYPVEVFTNLPPDLSTVPSASTISSPRTLCLVTPYFTARDPPAFVPMLPPMDAVCSPGSTG